MISWPQCLLRQVLYRSHRHDTNAVLHFWSTCWSLLGLMLLAVCAAPLFDLVTSVCSSALLSSAMALREVGQSRLSQHCQWFGLQTAPTNSRHLRLCASLFKTAAVSPCVVVSLVLVVPTHLRASRCLPVFARYHLASSILIRTLSGFPSGSLSRYVFLLIVSAPYLACEDARIVLLSLGHVY